MKTDRKRSQLQEKSVAKQFNAKTVVASGSLWFADSDVRSDKFLIECKTTEKDYYPLSAKVWEKIEREATKDHMRIPIMIIDLEDSDRMVVLSPKYFSTKLDRGYECSQNDPNAKSFRISKKYLDECTEDFGEPIIAKLFRICGEKPHLLFYMQYKDFIDVFKEEL